MQTPRGEVPASVVPGAGGPVTPAEVAAVRRKGAADPSGEEAEGAADLLDTPSSSSDSKTGSTRPPSISSVDTNPEEAPGAEEEADSAREAEVPGAATPKRPETPEEAAGVPEAVPGALPGPEEAPAYPTGEEVPGPEEALADSTGEEVLGPEKSEELETLPDTTPRSPDTSRTSSSRSETIRTRPSSIIPEAAKPETLDIVLEQQEIEFSPGLLTPEEETNFLLQELRILQSVLADFDEFSKSTGIISNKSYLIDILKNVCQDAQKNIDANQHFKIYSQLLPILLRYYDGINELIKIENAIKNELKKHKENEITKEELDVKFLEYKKSYIEINNKLISDIKQLLDELKAQLQDKESVENIEQQIIQYLTKEEKIFTAAIQENPNAIDEVKGSSADPQEEMKDEINSVASGEQPPLELKDMAAELEKEITDIEKILKDSEDLPEEYIEFIKELKAFLKNSKDTIQSINKFIENSTNINGMQIYNYNQYCVQIINKIERELIKCNAWYVKEYKSRDEDNKILKFLNYDRNLISNTKQYLDEVKVILESLKSPSPEEELESRISKSSVSYLKPPVAGFTFEHYKPLENNPHQSLLSQHGDSPRLPDNPGVQHQLTPQDRLREAEANWKKQQQFKLENLGNQTRTTLCSSFGNNPENITLETFKDKPGFDLNHKDQTTNTTKTIMTATETQLSFPDYAEDNMQVLQAQALVSHLISLDIVQANTKVTLNFGSEYTQKDLICIQQALNTLPEDKGKFIGNKTFVKIEGQNPITLNQYLTNNTKDQKLELEVKKVPVTTPQPVQTNETPERRSGSFLDRFKKHGNS